MQFVCSCTRTLLLLEMYIKDGIFYKNSEEDPGYNESMRLERSFMFTPDFPLERVAGAAALRGLKISHGFHQPLIAPLAPR